VGYTFCCCFLIFNDFFQSNDLNIYWTDLRQIFRNGKTVAVDDQSEIGSSITQGTLPWQPIFGFVRMTFARWRLRAVRDVTYSLNAGG